MNLAKRLIRISAVTAATVLMYEGALSLDRTTEANASLQADASPNTQKKAPETESDTIIKETTAETETEKTEKTSTKTKAPVKTAASAKSKATAETEATTKSKAPAETKASTEDKVLTEAEASTEDKVLVEAEDSTKDKAPTETEYSTEDKAPAETEDSTKDKAPAETEDSTETQTPGVTPEEESELASEGIRTESSASESSDPDTKYYLTSQYLLVPSFKNLKKDLNEMIDTYEGSWSIYVKDLKSGISLTINDQPQDSASLIKLYIAGAVLEKIQHQELEETETIDLLLSDMISLSDNEAANELVRYLSDSHEHQDGMEKVNEFIEEHDDLIVYDCYVDDGYTGTDFNRPGFQRLLEDMRKGNINCVLIKDLSRLGRNYIEVGNYIEQIFPLFNIRFIAVNDSVDSFNNPTSTNTILVPFKNLINDEYCRDTSIKIKSALNGRKKKRRICRSICILWICERCKR